MTKAEHWPAWLRIACRFGLRPCEFWLLSFVEWRALTESARAEVLARADLTALIGRFPDQTHD